MYDDPRDAEAALLRLPVSPRPTFEEERCATMGVFAPLEGIIGTLVAAEASRYCAQVPALVGVS